MEQLRSSVWSSETLLAGAQFVDQQPNGLLCKVECIDQDLQNEFFDPGILLW